MRVLVVDDDDANQHLFATLIELNTSANVVVFDGKPEALLDPSTYDGFDVILLDLMMPVVSGAMAVPVIREHHPECRIVLITAVGGTSLPDGIRGPVEASGGSVLPKPSTPQRIIEAIGAD